MTARAHVATDWMAGGVAVYLGEDLGGGRASAYDFANAQVKYDLDARAEPDVTPLRMSNEMAQALYGALADHFGHNATDTRMLRKDYDAERARVDKLTDAFVKIGATFIGVAAESGSDR